MCHFCQVATVEASHEALPMLLTVPNMRGGPYAGYSVLGFGDVVLPGLLLVYARIFDLRHRSSVCGGYFLPASVGYGCGLILTFIALLLELFGDQVGFFSFCTCGLPHVSSGVFNGRCGKGCGGCMRLLTCPSAQALDYWPYLCSHLEGSGRQSSASQPACPDVSNSWASGFVQAI